jgi:hypothetical protein
MPLTLNRLGELMKNPRKNRTTQYYKYKAGQYAEESIKKPYWLLYTKDLIPHSRNLNFKKQKNELRKFPKYVIPTAIEAVISLLTHYVKTGNYLHPSDPPTLTRTCNMIGERESLCVGSFNSTHGLKCAPSTTSIENNDCDIGLAGCMRFPIDDL